MSKRFDFDKEIDRLIDTDVLIRSAGDLSIVGGEFSAEKLSDFLNAWDAVWISARMPYRIWEYAHRITFLEPAATHLDLLERGRVFGADGDLSLRRDGGCFLWHFIGSNIGVPAGFSQRDFWKGNPSVELRPHSETALLWGKRDENSTEWRDDRVGWANLRYPGINSSRVMIDYTVYTDNGEVAFVWWKELKAYAEGND